MSTAVPITRTPVSTSDPAVDVLRRFALMAVVAFVLGFAGYLALGGNLIVAPAPDPAAVAAEPAAAASPASDEAVASPSADEWNLPKHI